MIGSKTTHERMLDLLVSDQETFRPVAGSISLRLIREDFDPSMIQTLNDVTEADFPGYAPILVPDSEHQTGYDPATGAYRAWITPPEGGFRWETTGAQGLPQTIYGAALVEAGPGGEVLAADRWRAPVVLTDVNQAVTYTEAHITLAPGALS